MRPSASSATARTHSELPSHCRLTPFQRATPATPPTSRSPFAAIASERTQSKPPGTGTQAEPFQVPRKLLVTNGMPEATYTSPPGRVASRNASPGKLPIADHELPSQLATLVTGMPPAPAQAPPATMRPSGRRVRARTGPVMPVPSGAHWPP
jgi:hypothetical protein